MLELLRRWGAKQSQGMSVELVDADRQLPIAYRNTIANMMAEAEALNGIFAPDDITYAVVSAEGHHRICRIRRSRRAPTPSTRSTRPSIWRPCSPMIAKPFSPGNAFPADEVARERITFDKAMIGSCTNGSYDDLLQAALVLRAAREQRRRRRSSASSRSFPDRAASAGRSSSRIRGSAASRSPRSSARSADEIRQSWCGPCFGQGPDALTPGQRAITSFNRNWQNRMGFGGEGYLASPAVVAASALLGFMAPPSELGLEWDPEAVRRRDLASTCRVHLSAPDDKHERRHSTYEEMMDWLTDPQIWIALATLTFLEIVLGVDNIIFISILSGKLPADQQPRARRVGLLGAMVTRVLLLFSLAWIIRLTAPLFTVVGHGDLGARSDSDRRRAVPARQEHATRSTTSSKARRGTRPAAWPRRSPA